MMNCYMWYQISLIILGKLKSPASIISGVGDLYPYVTLYMLFYNHSILHLYYPTFQSTYYIHHNRSFHLVSKMLFSFLPTSSLAFWSLSQKNPHTKLCSMWHTVPHGKILQSLTFITFTFLIKKKSIWLIVSPLSYVTSKPRLSSQTHQS